jgi:hypothetical protein
LAIAAKSLFQTDDGLQTRHFFFDCEDAMAVAATPANKNFGWAF